MHFRFALTNNYFRKEAQKIIQTRFQTVTFFKLYTRMIRPKRLKSLTLWGGTYLYSLCKGEPPLRDFYMYEYASKAFWALLAL